MHQKAILAAGIAAAVAVAMSVSAVAAETSAEQKYVEDRLNGLTLGPSAGSSTFCPDYTGGSADTILPAESADLTDYADRVFELVNNEREQAGLPLLERSDILDEAASIRAQECASVNSLYVDGKAHTRPDGSRWFAVLGVEQNYHYGENTGQGKTADAQVASWMESEGHRANILREDYTEIGIGYAVSEQGVLFAVQIFYRP